MLDFDALFDSLPSCGWLTKEEARTLLSAAKETQGEILESGSYYGRSTVLLASLGREVHTVDPFEGFDSDRIDGDLIEIELQFAVAGLPVTVYRMKIEDWPARPVGFAYLDGDHTYEGTLAQIQKAKECGASVIAVHDVNDSGGGLKVKQACLELLGPWGERVERLAIWKL